VKKLMMVRFDTINQPHLDNSILLLHARRHDLSIQAK
jgi:hypothetical protein